MADTSKYALMVANGAKWAEVFELLRKDLLEELAAQCDPLCDCTCCGRIFRGIDPDIQS